MIGLRVLLVAFAGFAVCAGIVAGSIAAPAVSDTFTSGEEAYIAFKFDDARRIYSAAAASPSQTAKERASALRQLGVMEWRLFERNEEARRAFDQALALGADPSATHAERARLAWSTGRFDDAIAAADRAAATASTSVERYSAALAFARAVTEKLRNVGLAEQSDTDRALLARARDLIRPFSDDPPINLKLAEVAFEIALRLEDGPLALIAWRSYAREGAASGTWAPATPVLARLLPSWRGRQLTASERADLFEALRVSQSFNLAALVANDARIAERTAFLARPRVRETIAYTVFVARVEDITHSYYRAVANGRGNGKAWQGELFAAGRLVWDQLEFAGARPAYSGQALDQALKARFGSYISIGETGGIVDLHYGHVFLDDARVIAQYGRTASIRRVAIDRMVDNGYESWIWDGRQAHGGWARTDHVVQVRSGYADGPLREWRQLTEPSLRAENEQRIARASAGDDAIAAADPAAYLPGLALRIDWQGENQVLERLRAQSAADLKGRFVVEFGRITLESNFFAHEGRHVLDKLAFDNSPQKLNTEELEFRAKLSEVAFSEAPRLSWGSIFNPTLNRADSEHGRANKRIAKGLVAWMQAHRSAIAGVDPKRPLLPQFDKLTDDQMREAMRSMDPWAK